MKKQVTITVAGVCGTGKSFLKYQIAKHLLSLGIISVQVIEDEINCDGILKRITSPANFVAAMNTSEVDVVIREAQLVRDLRAKGEKYKPAKMTRTRK